MTQHVLLVLREGEPPRCIGPFVAELSARREADAQGLREGEFLIQLLTPPVIAAQARRGRHALIPSPVPRDLMCEACGKPYLPTHSVAAPGPTAWHPFKLPTEFHDPDGIMTPPTFSPVGQAVDRMLRERDRQLGERGVRALYEQTPPPISPEGQAVAATLRRDLAAGGRPITQWVEEHADQLRRFVPQQLPGRPKEIDQ